MARNTARDLIELTKPRLSFLVLISTGVGMMLAPSGPPEVLRAGLALLATALVVGGANALNCYLERDVDALMSRTRKRPLPAGRLEPSAGLAFGLGISVVGVSTLLWIEPLASLLATVALLSYVLMYTPLKRKTAWCTIVGAIPGAIPPMIGWAVSSGSLGTGAWLLFAWIFLWQPPHFFALASLFARDYRSAGMPMLPVLEEGTRRVEWQMLFWTLLTIPLPLLLIPFTRAGTVTMVTAPILGLIFLAVVVRELWQGMSAQSARVTFTVSIAYLGLVFIAMVVDAGIGG